MSGWRPPSEVLTAAELEHFRRVGREARAVVPDAAFRRATQRIEEALRRNAVQCSELTHVHVPPP